MAFEVEVRNRTPVRYSGFYLPACEFVSNDILDLNMNHVKQRLSLLGLWSCTTIRGTSYYGRWSRRQGILAI
jgi:hypothetical protein